MTQLENAAAISKVYDKSGKPLGYLVPSDHQNGTYYQVTWDAGEIAWRCTCPAGQHGKSCRHSRGVSSLVAAQMEAKSQVAQLNSAQRGEFRLMR